MRHGLIARPDEGGIGTQTWEYARHMNPDRVLLVDLATRARGRSRPERFEGFDVVDTGPRIDNETLDRFIDGLDVVFTVEGAYRHGLGDYLYARRTSLVVQVNPELYRARDLGIHHPVLPTGWRSDLFAPTTPGLPVPINRDVLPYRHRDHVERLLHICAPAMADRAGTTLVFLCAKFVQHPVDIVLHVPYGCPIPDALAGRGDVIQIGNVRFEVRTAETPNYYDVYTDDVDALLAPRRYGGLSLPMQEAASRGMPIITLYLDPQRNWPGVMLVPASTPDRVPMKGGTFDVWACDPHDLAMAIDKLTAGPELVSTLSRMADEWAGTLAWPRWTGPYHDTLARAVG